MNKTKVERIPTMLTVNETAERVKIAKHHARQLALSGKVKAVRTGRKTLINEQSVIDYFNNSTLVSSDSHVNHTVL